MKGLRAGDGVPGHPSCATACFSFASAHAQAMWYYVQPPLASLGLAASIASEASCKKLRGASLLNLLHAKSASVAGARANTPCYILDLAHPLLTCPACQRVVHGKGSVQSPHNLSPTASMLASAGAVLQT